MWTAPYGTTFFPPPTSSRRDTHVWKKRVGDLDHLRAAEGRRRPSLRLLLVSASDHTARLRPYIYIYIYTPTTYYAHAYYYAYAYIYIYTYYPPYTQYSKKLKLFL